MVFSQLMKHLVERIQGGELFSIVNGLFNDIYMACRKGMLKVVQRLIEEDSKLIKMRDVNIFYRSHGMTPLMHASAWGNIEVVKYLINKKADINEKDIDNCNFFHINEYTSLIHASRNDHVGIIEYLYEKMEETTLDEENISK